MAAPTIGASRFATLDDLADWRYLLDSIHVAFRAPSFRDAAALAAAIAELADAHGHHPDLAVRPPGTLRVTLSRPTAAHVELARAISRSAAAAGAVAEPQALATVEVAIDAMDIPAVRPFWAAVLGYDVVDGDLVDPARVGPAVWFQQMDAPRPQRNRFHVDVVVPHDEGEARLAAALAAGGTLVSDAHARAFWVLADAEGNEACVCTWQDRV